MGPDFATATWMQMVLRAIGTVSMATGFVLVLFAGALAAGLVGIGALDAEGAQAAGAAAPYFVLGGLAMLVGWLTRRLGVSERRSRS
jgi:uncharacterized membrane protein YgdD (TMEM256/DUF423 family)